MITYKRGDLLAVESGVIIHGCNAKGIMGSGVALAVKTKYPKVYEAYKSFEKSYGLRLGSLSCVKLSNSLSIVNAVTQETYGREPIRYVSYGALHLCFEKLNDTYIEDTPFHFPKIGAGLGNGDWSVISQLIDLACPTRELICWEL